MVRAPWMRDRIHRLRGWTRKEIVMTRFFRGTTGNDVINGQEGFDRNVFSDIGAGGDTVTGGTNSDIFHMTVDRKIDHVDGGAGRDLIDYSASDYQLNI